MKQTISFEGDYIEDRDELTTIINAHKLSSALNTIDAFLRSLDRHGGSDGIIVKEESRDLVDQIRTKFYEILKDEGVSDLC